MRHAFASVSCAIWLFALLCGCSSDKDKCEAARDVYIAQAERQAAEHLEGEPEHSPERLITTAEIALARHNFAPRCKALDAESRACVGRLKELVKLEETFQSERKACPEGDQYEACVDALRAKRDTAGKSCMDALKPFFESLYVRDPDDDAAPVVPVPYSFEFDKCTQTAGPDEPATEPEGESDSPNPEGAKPKPESAKPAGKDARRGQYAMKRGDEDPQLAKRQAIDQARKAGVLGALEQLEAPPGGLFESLLATDRNPLEAHASHLEACLRQHKLARDSFVLEYRVGDDGALTAPRITGIEAPSATACIEKLAGEARTTEDRKTRTYRCQVSFQAETP